MTTRPIGRREWAVPDWEAICRPAASAASGKALDPAARGLLVELYAGGGVRVTGTDMGVWGVGQVGETEGEPAWTGVLPPRVASLRGAVTLTPTAEGHLDMACPESNYTVPVGNTEHFPAVPGLDGGEPEHVPNLLPALKVVSPAMSVDRTVIVLCGALLEREDAVGSTGFLLHAGKHGGSLSEPVILERRTVETLLGAAQGGEGGWLTVWDGGGTEGPLVEVAGGDTEGVAWWVVGRAVRGEYLDWRSLIARGGTEVGTVPGRALAEAIAAAVLLSEAQTPLVRLERVEEVLAVYLAEDPSGQDACGGALDLSGGGGWPEDDVLVEAGLLRTALDAVGTGSVEVVIGDKSLTLRGGEVVAVVARAERPEEVEVGA